MSDYSSFDLEELLSKLKESDAAKIAAQEAQDVGHLVGKAEQAAVKPLTSSLVSQGKNLEALRAIKNKITAPSAPTDYSKMFGPGTKGYAEDILASQMKPGRTAADAAKVLAQAPDLSTLGNKSAAESAEVLAKAPAFATELPTNLAGKSAAESASVLANAPAFPESVEPAPSQMKNMLTELRATKPVVMAENAAAKVGSKMAPFVEKVGEKLAPATEAMAPWMKATGEVAKDAASTAGKVATKLAPAARVAAKVAGPLGWAYEALSSANAGADSDIPMGPMLSAAELEASAGGAPMANTDLLPSSPNQPSDLFARVSGQMGDFENSLEGSPEGRGLANGTNSVSGSLKTKTTKETRGGTPVTPKTPETPTPEVPVESEEGYQLGTLENLEKAQRDSRLLNMLGGLSDTGSDFLNNTKAIGDMFTTNPSKVSYGKDAGKSMREAGDQIVKDHEKKVDNQKNDPKSQASVEMRNLMKEMGFPFGKNTSAADLEKKFPGLSNIYTQRKAQEARKEQYEFQAGENSKNRQADRESREEVARWRIEDKKDAKSNEYSVKAAERINRFEQTDDVKALRSTQSAASIVDAAIAEKDPNKRRGLLGPAMMMFGKIAQGDNSVLREGDQKVLTSNYGLNGDLIEKVAAAARGEKGLTDIDLANMKRVIQGVADLKAGYVRGQIEKEKSLGQKLYPGMTYEGLFNPDTMKAIGYDGAGNPIGKKTQDSAGADTVKMMAPNGKIKLVRKSQVEAAIASGGKLLVE